MGQYVHFDVAAIRKQAEVASAAATARLLASATTEDDRQFILAQDRFARVVIEATVVSCELCNEGFSDENIAGAAGIALGKAFAGTSSSLQPNGQLVAVFTHWFAFAVNDAPNRDMISFGAVEGGRA